MCNRIRRFFGLSVALILILVTGNSEQSKGAQPECTVVVQPGQSIQQAIDQAAEGAVICLGQFGEGGSLPTSLQRWSENVTITQSLTLRGLHPKLTRIVGEQKGQPVIRIESDVEIQVIIEDLTIAEAKEAEQSCCDYNGIQVGGRAHVVLRHSTVSHNAYSGLEVKDGATISLINSRIVDNKSSGLVMGDSTQVTLNDSQVSGNGHVGLSVRDTATMVVRNSHVFDNTESGLSVSGSAEVSLTDSQVLDNGASGLYILGLAQVSLTNSQINGNGRRGREDTSTGADGLFVWQKARVSLINSQISGNTGNGLYVIDSATLEVQDSWISDNVDCGILPAEYQGAKVTGRNNWVWYNGENLCRDFSPPEGFLRPENDPPRPLLGSAQVCAQGCLFSEIGPAIWAVRPGGEVQIRAGNYRGILVLTKNLTLVGAGGGQTVLTGTSEGIHIVGSVHVQLQGLQVSGYATGVVVEDTALAIITDSRFENNRTCGISGEFIFGWGNQFVKSGTCGSDARRLSRTLPPNPHSRLQVAVPQEAPTIQQAIDWVAEGGTITVAPGTYEETLEILNASFVLSGVDKNQVRIQSVGSSTVLIFAETAKTTQLKDLTITGSYRGYLRHRHDLVVRGQAVLNLVNSTVTTEDRERLGGGIHARDKVQVTIAKSQLTSTGCNLVVEDSAKAEIDDSVIQDTSSCVGNFIGGAAIIALESAQVKLSNSQVSNNTATGLSVQDSAQVSLINSRVTDNVLGGGLWVKDSAQVSLQNSTVSGNGRQTPTTTGGLGDGLSVQGRSRVSLSNSLITSNRESGVSVYDSAQVVIVSTQLSENGKNGLSVQGSAVAEIQETQISDNGECGISRSDEAKVVGRNNFVQDNDEDFCGFNPSEGFLRPEPPRPLLDEAEVCPRGCAFTALAPAIRAVRPEGTVRIQAGTYPAGITLKKSLTLRGVGNEQTILKGKATSKSVIAVKSEDEIDVVLEGLAIEGVGEAPSYGMDVQGKAKVALRDIRISNKEGIGLRITDSAQVSLTHSRISGSLVGVNVEGSAQVSLTNSQVLGNQAWGLVAGGSAQVNLTNSQVSENGIGLEVVRSARVNLTSSQVFGNGVQGLAAHDSATVTIKESTVEKNGIGVLCTTVGPIPICTGIAMVHESQMMIMNSTIIDNADWGVGAWLKQCGYTDSFTGKVVFEGKSVIAGNNKLGKLNGQGNPGNHPFKNLPDGQVCLP